MRRKCALLTLCRDEIAPRFDMTLEALIAPPASSAFSPGDVPALEGPAENARDDHRRLVLAHASSEELCDIIIRAGVSVVVCGGIEEDYYHYLRWKRIEVISDVMGPLGDVLRKLRQGALQAGDCLYGGRHARGDTD